MRHPQGSRDQIRKQRHAGMRLKEFFPYGKQFGIEKFFYPRQVNLSVLCIGMVTVHYHRPRGEQRERQSRLVLSQLDFGDSASEWRGSDEEMQPPLSIDSPSYRPGKWKPVSLLE